MQRPGGWSRRRKPARLLLCSELQRCPPSGWVFFTTTVSSVVALMTVVSTNVKRLRTIPKESHLCPGCDMTIPDGGGAPGPPLLCTAGSRGSHTHTTPLVGISHAQWHVKRVDGFLLSAWGYGKDVVYSRFPGSEDIVGFRGKSAFGRQNQAS